MTQPASSDVQTTYPPNNALRVGIVGLDANGGIARNVSVQGTPVNCGWIDPAIPVPTDNVALLRGESSWLALGTVRSTPPSGRVDWVASSSASAAIGAEATVLTSNSITWQGGMAYVIEWSGQTTNTAAATVTFRLRKGSLTGTGLAAAAWQLAAAGNAKYADAMYVRVPVGLTVTDVVLLTLQASAGTATMASLTTNIRYMTVRVAGGYNDYPGAFDFV